MGSDRRKWTDGGLRSPSHFGMSSTRVRVGHQKRNVRPIFTDGADRPGSPSAADQGDDEVGFLQERRHRLDRMTSPAAGPRRSVPRAGRAGWIYSSGVSGANAGAATRTPPRGGSIVPVRTGFRTRLACGPAAASGTDLDVVRVRADREDGSGSVADGQAQRRHGAAASAGIAGPSALGLSPSAAQAPRSCISAGSGPFLRGLHRHPEALVGVGQRLALLRRPRNRLAAQVLAAAGSSELWAEHEGVTVLPLQ